MEWLRDNEDEAMRIAANAARFAEDFFSREAVDEYLLEYLTTYRSLQSWSSTVTESDHEVAVRDPDQRSFVYAGRRTTVFCAADVTSAAALKKMSRASLNYTASRYTAPSPEW